MAKKKKKSWKKKLLKAALIGGALYGGSKLLKNRRATSIADMDDAAINVTHDALKPNWISKKAEVVDTQPIIEGGSGAGGVHQGRPKNLIFGQRKTSLPPSMRGGAPVAEGYQRYGITGRTGRGRAGVTHGWTDQPLKGGGIAKRGTGAAYKSGGRVKSMGIAKRGGGIAKR